MSDDTRCEPPEHLRHIGGKHWLRNAAGELFWDVWDVDNREWWERGKPNLSGAAGCTYIAPVAPPAVVRALVEALEKALSTYRQAFRHKGTGRHDPEPIPDPEWVTEARAALAAAKEAGQ